MMPLLVMLCVVACQEETDDARVRAIVDKLVGRTTDPRMPAQFVNEPRIFTEDNPEEPPAAAAADELEDEAPPAARAHPVALTANSFDTWVFGNMSAKGVPEVWIESVLRKRLILYGMRHRLSAAELAKLHLAGRGDIKRLFDEIAAKRKDFDATRRDFRKAGPALQAANPLRNQFMNGPFEAGSLFSKALAKILNDRKVAPAR